MKKQFRDKFGDFGGELYTSPGRVNLIGEHTDYNGGFVFPGAIDKGMVAVIRKNGTGKVRAWSVDLQDYAEFTMEESDLPKASWAR
ncbi:MAG: galactokinase family protein, partial [Bacteroidales bacterium]